MGKSEQLEKLRNKIVADNSLPLIPANLVFGEGNPDCSVMFIGEAPGFHEDKLGRPFVGQAGKLLDKLIAEIGWKRQDVYITNIVKRRPPENRDPFPDEIESYKPCLAEQIKIINPKVIAPLGRFSMNYFLPFAKISRDQGKVFTISSSLFSKEDGNKGEDFYIIYPLYHPAAALRATAVLNDLRAAFKKLPDVVSGKFHNLIPSVTANKTSAAHSITLSIKKQSPPQAKLF